MFNLIGNQTIEGITKTTPKFEEEVTNNNNE